MLLKSGSRKNDLPFIAKIANLWEDPVNGKCSCVHGGGLSGFFGLTNNIVLSVGKKRKVLSLS